QSIPNTPNSQNTPTILNNQNQQPSTPETPEKEETVQEAPVSSKPEIFTLKSDRQQVAAPTVLGTVDLSAINQSTRPKKKSKEEKRKEREEKSAERKKRNRIGKERVDVNDTANHQQGGKNGKNARTTAGKPGQQPQQQVSGKKKNKKKGNQPQEVSDEDVARQVKETLARLTSKTSQNKKGAKYRKEKRDAAAQQREEDMLMGEMESKTLKLTEFVTVSELANMMDVPVTKLIGTLMSVGIMVSINQRLDAETINLVADEFGYTTEYVSAEVQEAIQEVEDDENDLISRAPIVTVMGHVDHGKTSLLDYVRNTNVIAGEAGGITQHIGAYNVKLADGRRITFLDTPGHEAFTAMRARGTQVTDIAIIIIAADDSIMPTTKEAIAHAQAANVPMVFAINKIDKPGANPDKIRQDLAAMNLLVEEWGGKYQCQEISAKKGTGVEELMEKVLLEAEMLDLKANPNRNATGSVIESSLDKGRGFISTVLVSNGTLKVGDIVIAGTAWGRVKAMFNERNQNVEQARPAEPVIILGLNGAPQAGDSFHIMETEQEAKTIANKRMQLQREQSLRATKTLSLEEIAHRVALGEFHELNLVVKADTQGSVEALSDSFIKMSTEKVQVNVILKGVGQISENDVTLASTAENGMIVGFQVRPSVAAKKLAEQEGVEINTYSVIYDAMDDIKAAMEGMLDKIKKEVATGQVEVKEVFKISKVGTVAGAMVNDGKVHAKDKARLIRDGIVIFTGEINALKRYKDDVKEVATGFECGISLVNFNDIQSGDIIETFTEIEVEQKL
ncbi:MAG: translation initiation factor IF-2, partial [Prevotella sp.]|nr:translation initiation factor IF-2 [Prevotella sp.]